jgi:nucleoside phosphorylase
MYLSRSFFLLASACCFHFVNADIGLLSFWIPELYALLDKIEAESSTPVVTHIFGGRKFYVTNWKGHNVVIANTGVGISNAAATTAIMLQKFPSIDRIIGSGIAGGVVRPFFSKSDATDAATWIF